MIVVKHGEDCLLPFPDLGVAIDVRSSQETAHDTEPAVEIRVVRQDDQYSGEIFRRIRLEGLSDHRLRNQFNLLGLAVALGRKQVQAGKPGKAARHLSDALDSIYREQLDSGKPSVSSLPTDSNADSLAGNDSEQRDSRVNLLLVEGADDANSISGFMRLFGFRVASVADCSEASHYLKHDASPDCVLIDEDSIGPDSVSAFCESRRNGVLKPLAIFVIGEKSRDQYKLSIEDGAALHWFGKPIKYSEIAFTMQRSVATCSCRQE